MIIKYTFTFLLSFFLVLSGLSQPFEGRMVCEIKYKSKLPNVKSAQFSNMLGTTQEYFIREGNYKAILNGSFLQWQLYVNGENKIYSKTSQSDTLWWEDAGVSQDTVLKAEVNEGVTTILGYRCDELILTCRTGVQKYYYNSTIPVDARVFVNHKYGNWYEVVSRTGAMPLKTIVENDKVIVETQTTEVESRKLGAAMFRLPTGAKTKRAPF